MAKSISSILAAGLALLGLGCGTQEASEPAPDRPLPPSGAANRAETAPTDAPGVRDRVPGAVTRSAAGAGSDPMDPTSDAYIAERPERLAVPESSDPEAHAAEQAELLADLDSFDSEARADAADWIDLEGKALERMISLLKSDPDADVRATIVDRLGEDASPSALAALVGALQDPDPEVVLQAIEVLEFEAEEWVIPELEPLLGHSDEEVREAAEDAIAFLQ